MKTLLYKQLRLVCQPMTLVFCLFGVMLLIPAYPYTVMWFYVMLGLFFSFLNGREQKDVYYSALLPIRKRDTVKANCLFVGLIEVLALVIAVPFALLRAKLGIGDNPVGLNANVTLFACGLMLFAVFNAVFLLSFYRTAYKVGVSFVKACIVMAVAAFIMEAAVHFPALSRFNGYDLACQLPLLAAGLVIWCGSWPLIFRGAAADTRRLTCKPVTLSIICGRQGHPLNKRGQGCACPLLLSQSARPFPAEN